MAAKDESLEALFAAINLLTFDVGSNFYALPTYLVDPHDFYVVPLPCKYHLSVLNTANQYYQPEELKVNKVVVYWSKNLNCKIRGKIRIIGDDQKCTIFAIDHGFVEEKVNVKRIYHPEFEEAITTEPLAIHCALDLCTPLGAEFSVDCIETFKFFIGDEKLKIIIRRKSANKLIVTVYNSNTDDIATLLAYTNCSHLSYYPGQAINDKNADAVDYSFNHKPLLVGETLIVRVQSGSTLDAFYVAPVVDYKKYISRRGEFTAYCKSLVPITSEDLVPGTSVGVQEDYSLPYERATILAIVQKNRANVRLVDWGKELEVPVTMIKAIKSELYKHYPVLALYCSAPNTEPWNNNLPQFLYKGYCFTMCIMQVGDGFESPHIVKLNPAK